MILKSSGTKSQDNNKRDCTVFHAHQVTGIYPTALYGQFFTGIKMFSLSRYFLFTGLFAFIHIFILSAAMAADSPRKTPWHISALTINYDNNKDIYTAINNVVITSEKIRVEADYAEFIQKTKNILAKGNVVLTSEGDSILCDSIEMNLNTKTGIIRKGRIFIKKNNLYVRGDNIKKTGNFSYKVGKGSMTSCPKDDDPHWKITARSIDIDIKRYGSADHIILWIEKIPVLYMPFLTFPIKKNQTGLLWPKISSSESRGFEYEQPLFIMISDNVDTTLYADYMTDRGIKIGTELRYILNRESKGTVFFDFLEDKKYGSGASEKKSDRYWFRMKHVHSLPGGFRSNLDIDLTSDADYLREFKDGHTGYDKTKEYFQNEFGRSLDEYDSTIRENRLNIGKSWSTGDLRINALWYDNVIARRSNTKDTSLHTLPGIELDISKKRMGSSNFFYKLDSEYRYFYRKDTTSTLVKGKRADVYSKLYMDLKTGRYFSIEPFFGTRGTVWSTDNFNGDDNSIRTRKIYDAGVKASTKITKIYSPDNGFADKIKHEIIPKLEYKLVPDIPQNHLPFFDSLDRIDEENTLTWSLTNRLISKNSLTVPEKREFAWVKLYQNYDIKKKRNNVSKSSSDIFLETALNLNDFTSVDMDLSWSPHTYYFKTLNIGGTLRDKRKNSLKAEYRYEKDFSEFLYTRLDLKLAEKLNAYISYEKNLKDNQRLETKVGLNFEKLCSSLNISYSDMPGQKRLTFFLNLKGIGELGVK